MVPPKIEKYELQCEWANCRELHDDIENFYKHLDQHFWTDIAAEPLEPGCTLVCQWCECNFVTTNGHDLIRHIYFHGFHTKLKWLGFLKFEEAKCGECQINQNRNIIPELPDGFKCCWEDCFVIVDIPDKFYSHVREHVAMSDPEKTVDGKKVFKCHWEGCNYEYNVDSKGMSLGRHKLRGHMNTHTQERCYACPWCGNLYVNKTKLIDHYTRQTSAEYHTFQCTHCSRTFASERILKDHMRHHVNHYQCSQCAMTCPNPSALKHHIRYKHSTERPFACEFCEYRSKEPHDLQIHMQFHQSDLSYHCQFEDCDYVVRSIQNLRYHYRVKHASGDGKHYACHMCDKKYATGYQLTHHLGKTHNFQWPPGHCRFKYKECEDGFFRLQIFRYESIELTKQLMNKKKNSKDSNDPTTSSIIASSGKPNTRLNLARRKKADAARKLTMNNTTRYHTRKLRKSRAKNTTSASSKKKSTRKKSAAVSPKVTLSQNSETIPPMKRNTTSTTLFKETSQLPDLYINTEECLEAADALCNMKSNSVVKKKLDNQQENIIEFDCHRTESRDSFLSEIYANAVDIDSDDTIELDIDSFQPTSERIMHTRNVGVTTRSSSSKKSSPTAIATPSRRFAKARKRLKLTTLKKTVRKTSSPSKLTSKKMSLVKVVKECSVEIVPLDAPVFPDHHKLYCDQVVKDVAVPSHVESAAKNVFTEAYLPASLVEELIDLPHSEFYDSQFLTSEIADVDDANTQNSEPPISTRNQQQQLLKSQNKIQDLPCSKFSDTQSQIPDIAQTKEQTEAPHHRQQLSKLQNKNHDLLQSEFCDTQFPDSEISDLANLKASNATLCDQQPLRSQNNTEGNDTAEPVENKGSVSESRHREIVFDNIETSKLVEVNRSEIVMDGEGNRTVVSVGGEDFYLVSGTDTTNGGTIYCLVKSTEFTETEK